MYLRKKTGLTQTELGEKLGKTNVTIGDYERGKASPPVDVLLKLADIFNVTLDELVRVDIRSQGGPSKSTNNAGTQIDARTERFIHLLEQRVQTLEQLILETDPDLAKKMGLL